MQEAHVVLLSRLHWLLCTGVIVAESGPAVKPASDLHCSSGALGGREADERPSGQAVMAEKSIPPRRSASICMMHFRGCSCRVCGVCGFANAGIVLDNRICQATLHVAHCRPAFWCTSSPGPTGIPDDATKRYDGACTMRLGVTSHVVLDAGGAHPGVPFGHGRSASSRTWMATPSAGARLHRAKRTRPWSGTTPSRVSTTYSCGRYPCGRWSASSSIAVSAGRGSLDSHLT